MNLQIKRIYNQSEPDDGYRILVDRLWPRGISKEKAKIERWMKEIAPSPDLRKWFGHKEERFQEFRQRYIAELEESNVRKELLKEINELSQVQRVTLLYGAKNETFNHALVLKEVLS